MLRATPTPPTATALDAAVRMVALEKAQAVLAFVALPGCRSPTLDVCCSIMATSS
ncbi:hypothetical protein [Novacetimonas pomaceti]|uniref:hypothetical protein n=1 Tax=Novacetimonas pomaceti TaxID=2021998 RepID=UPI001EF09DCA|nr:hypothetical protein [Novacetimonas pomaceti]